MAFYYQNANPFLAEIGVTNPTAKMAIGQVSEVLFMLLLPLFIQRFGIKIALLVGMLAWALRYLLFAYGNNGDLAFMLFTGIALHGICYDFFFVSGQIYTDAKASERFRSSAQGLITLATYGLGMLIGFWVAGAVTDHYASAESHDWKKHLAVPGRVRVGDIFFLFLAGLQRAATRGSAVEYLNNAPSLKKTPSDPVGAGLLAKNGGSGDINVDCAAVFANAFRRSQACRRRRSEGRLRRQAWLLRVL